MTNFFFANASTNAAATMSAEAASSCTSTGRFCARNNSMITILDTITMVSIFVVLVLVLGTSLILVNLLGLSILLIGLLVLISRAFPTKEQPQPV